MKNFTFKSIFTILALMLAMTGYSQDRTCGMVEYMEEMLKDPVFAKEYEENQKKLKEEIARRLSTGEFSNRGGATIEIPVAVHYPDANEADRACLEALAQNQIDILNADYTATNGDISIWNTQSSVFFPGLNAGAANISFCIATSNHPVGLDPELLEGNPCVSIGYNFGGGVGNADGNWSGYMNFVVRNIGGGLLGFSPLNGSVAAGQAVTMNTFAFGSGSGCPGSGIVPGAPYNLGRTVTHELGHFYGLNHTFNADGGGVCGVGGDGIADTPEVANSTYGCPAIPGPFGCNGRALTMNYMDYVNDACMYMFTPGQMNNVDAYMNAVLAAQFKPNVCVAPTPGFTLTANDSPMSSCPNTDTSVDFNLTYTTILDFNETTTFSATGLPANATVNFSPATLNDDGNFVMTVGNLGATAVGDYTITVTGTSNSVTETVDVELDNNCTVITCNDYVATDTPQVISAVGAGLTYTSVINVTEDMPIDDINVSFSIDHTWIRDITATITSPNGTEVELTSVNGVNGVGEYQNTLFDQEATTPVDGDTPTNNIFIGPYIPEGDLSLIYGEMSAGNWTLTITDNFDQDGGNLTSFEIELCLEDQLSISEFESNGFAIFPNPNNGEFTIKLNSNSGNDIIVEVFDIRGRKIFNNAYTNNGDFKETVSLNSVHSGMYLVTVNDGVNEITKRIIVD